MLKFHYLFVLTSLFAWSSNSNAQKESVKKIVSKIPTAANTAKPYYFDKALVYEYINKTDTSEIWIYVNTKTRQLLYEPGDMIDAVISFPNGNYKIFGNTKDGKFVVKNEHVANINLVTQLDPSTTKINDSKIIKSSVIPPFLCQGYYMKYVQMAGGETFYATNQIPINSKQLYGFTKLNGDAKLDLPIDFTNVLTKNQVLTHLKSNDIAIRLISYTHTSYYFDPSKFKPERNSKGFR